MADIQNSCPNQKIFWNAQVGRVEQMETLNAMQKRSRGADTPKSGQAIYISLILHIPNIPPSKALAQKPIYPQNSFSPLAYAATIRHQTEILSSDDRKHILLAWVVAGV